MQFALLQLDTFIDSSVDLVNSNRSIYCTHIYERFAFLTMAIGHTRQRLSTIELEDKCQILVKRPLIDCNHFIITEGYTLPVLTLVLTKIKNFKRFTFIYT